MRIPGLVTDELAVGGDGFLEFFLALVKLADGELGPPGGRGLRGVVANLAEHGDGLVQRQLGFQAEHAGFHVAVGRGLRHGRLPTDGGAVEAAALETGEKLVVSLKGFFSIAFLLKQLGLPETRLRRGRGEGETRRGLVIKLDRAAGFSRIISGFCLLIERLALAGSRLGVSRHDRQVLVGAAGSE